MIADLGLIATIGICAWIALDASVRRDRPGFGRLSALGAAVIAWCAGELLLHHASDPETALWSRRLLYAGLCAFGPLWLWTAAEIYTPKWARRHLRVLLGAIGSVEAFVYASLYVSPAALVSGSGQAPVHGPLFALHAVTLWLSIVLAIVFQVSTVWRLAGARRRASSVLILGSATPLLANWLYFALGSGWRDPTPIVVGVGAVAFRLYMLDLVGSSAIAAAARVELFDQMEVGIFLAGAEGEILHANSYARRLLDGREPRGDALETVVVPFTRDPGFDVRCFPIVRRDLEVGGGCVVSDRREARGLEHRAEMGSRMEALGLLSRGLAHEINNPLTVVLGNASLLGLIVGDLAQSARGDAMRAAAMDAQDLVERIEGGADRIASVVSRMSYLAESEPSGDPPRAEVLSLVRKTVGLAAMGNDEGRIETEDPERSLHAAARAEDVVQILLQLLRNALDASPVDQAVLVRIEATQDHVVVRILDRGSGLPEERPSVVFDPFYTSKSPGDGMGLALGLCWELARQNGGELEALPRPGGGAEFRLRLPRA